MAIKLGNNDITFKVGSTDVDAIYLGSTLMYSGGTPPTPSYSGQYLTFVATEDGTFSFTNSGMSYSFDSGTTWTTLASKTDSPTVNANSKIMWKANLTPSPSKGIGHFTSSGHFTAEGNVMSLLYGDNFEGQTSLSGKGYAFFCLFLNCSGLTSAENLSLPATTLVTNCYQNMFQGCTSLTTAPELPATTLEDYCYRSMFYNCTSLTTAPQLPSTTLSEGCYANMFQACTSLTTAPQLPATTLAEWCYNYMFQGCTGLTTAPQLSATTLAKYCYNYMFQGCTSLNSITCLATDISASNCTYNWVNGVASSGTFTKASSMRRWGNCGGSKIPCNWTVQDYAG